MARWRKRNKGDYVGSECIGKEWMLIGWYGNRRWRRISLGSGGGGEGGLAGEVEEEEDRNT